MVTPYAMSLPKSLKWAIAAPLSVVVIVLIANLFKPSPWFAERLPVNQQEVELASGDGQVDTAAEVNLTAEWPSQSDTLSYSTQAEVARFTLTGKGPFTLRYLTLQVESHALKPIENWKVYEVQHDSVDFKKPVGFVEKSEGSMLKVRLFSSPASAYLFEDGEQTFALVAQVLGDPTSSESPSLTLNFPRELSADFDWAWLPGLHSQPWIDVEENLGIIEVGAVSQKPLTKH